MAVIPIHETGTALGNGAALATAITTAVLGDTIRIDAGIVCQGNFQLIDKGAGTSYITIESSAMASLPDGQRVDPSQLAYFATIQNTDATPIFSFMASSHHWHLRGLHLTTSAAFSAAGSLMPQFISGAGAGVPPLAEIPHDLIIERCLIHPYETDPTPWRSASRGIALDGANITIKHNYIWDFGFWEPQKDTNDGYNPVTPGTGLTIVAATNANPVKVTTSVPHSLPSTYKWLVTFTGGTGAWAVLNGTKVATYVSATEMTLADYDPVTCDSVTPINTTSASPVFASAGQSIRRLNQVGMNNQAILLTVGPGPYLIHDNWLEAYFTIMFSGGAGATLMDPLNEVTVTAVADVGTVTLSGLGAGGSRPLTVGDLIAFKYAQPQAVTAATISASPTTPCRLTVAPHRYPANIWRGPEYRGCRIAGATGEWSDINTTYNAGTPGASIRFFGKTVDATHIDLYVGSEQNVNAATPYDSSVTHTGPLTGTVTWVPESSGPTADPLHWQVGKITSINPTTKVITYDYQGHSEGIRPNDGDGNGAGVPVLVGSPAQFNGIVIRDITVTRNTFSVPRKWLMLFMHIAGTENYKGSGPKGLWESKNSRNVLIEGNIHQTTGGVLPIDRDTPGTYALNVVNQSGGTPWMENSNWVIRSNVFIGFGYTPIGHTEEYESGIASHGFTMENNVFTRSASNWLVLFDSTDATVRHNTIQCYPSPSGTIGWTGPITIHGHSTNSIVTDNIFNFETGYKDFSGTWDPDRENNYLIDAIGSDQYPGSVPAEDVGIDAIADMKFVDVTAGDAGDCNGYQLAGDSPGKGAATNGKDVGVNFALLNRALGLKRPILR